MSEIWKLDSKRQGINLMVSEFEDPFSFKMFNLSKSLTWRPVAIWFFDFVALLNNIFDSFFTTKGVKGMGMGLSISRSIVELHGGRIWAESVLGEGTCVSFTLPCVNVAATNTPENESAEMDSFLP